MLASRRGAAIRPAAASRKACVAVRAYLPDQRASKAAAWTPDSWRKLPVVQQPTYPDKEAVQKTLMDISAFPPLIFGEDQAWRKRCCMSVTCGRRAQRVLQLPKYNGHTRHRAALAGLGSAGMRGSLAMRMFMHSFSARDGKPPLSVLFRMGAAQSERCQRVCHRSLALQRRWDAALTRFNRL